jgi:acyl-CoA synthetase (AMP-forming)/AMP-acid ligase II
VAKPGHILSVDDLKKACKEHLHNWKCPKQYQFVDEIPRNTMGKVLKDQVKGMFISL